jgi:hypothetical protein
MTLDELKEKFSDWRANKKTLSEPVPPQLWADIQVQLKAYPAARLCKELKITYGQLKNKGLIESKPATQLKSSDFLKIESSLRGFGELTLQGEKRALHLKIELSSIGQVLPFLATYL